MTESAEWAPGSGYRLFTANDRESTGCHGGVEITNLVVAQAVKQ